MSKAGWLLLSVGLVVLGASAAYRLVMFVRHPHTGRAENECRTNLRQAHLMARAHFIELDLYATRLAPLGFEPERGNRYAYFLDGKGSLQDRSERETVLRADATGVGVDTFQHPAARPVSRAQLPETFAGGLRLGLRPDCAEKAGAQECPFLFACAANFDGDPALDVWTISNADRAAPDGSRIPAGQPYAEASDL